MYVTITVVDQDSDYYGCQATLLGQVGDLFVCAVAPGELVELPREAIEIASVETPDTWGRVRAVGEG